MENEFEIEPEFVNIAGIKEVKEVMIQQEGAHSLKVRFAVVWDIRIFGAFGGMPFGEDCEVYHKMVRNFVHPNTFEQGLRISKY